MAKNIQGNVISVSLGITKSLGNYESFRIDAMVSEEVEDIYAEEAWDKLFNLVDEKISEQLEEGGLVKSVS